MSKPSPLCFGLCTSRFISNCRAQTFIGWQTRRWKSNEWRRKKDHYAKQAQEEGLRSRASFKLQQMNEKLSLLRPGMTVIELGASPGGWTLVAARAVRASKSAPWLLPLRSKIIAESDVTSSSQTEEFAQTHQNDVQTSTAKNVARAGRVICCDLLPMQPVAGATFVQGDFMDPAVQGQILAALKDRRSKTKDNRSAAIQGDSISPHPASICEAPHHNANTSMVAEHGPSNPSDTPADRITNFAAAGGHETPAPADERASEPPRVATEPAAGGAAYSSGDQQVPPPAAVPGARSEEGGMMTAGGGHERGAEWQQGAAGREADVVLSDMAPNCCGSAEIDHQRIVRLCRMALDLAQGVLRPGGKMLVKLFNGAELHNLLQVFSHGIPGSLVEKQNARGCSCTIASSNIFAQYLGDIAARPSLGLARFYSTRFHTLEMKESFKTVRIVKPDASRSESSELYIYASGFTPPAPCRRGEEAAAASAKIADRSN